MATRTKNIRGPKRTKRARKTAQKPRITVGPISQTFPAGTPIQVERGPLPEGLVERAAERASILTDPRIPVLTPELQASMDADERAREQIVASIGPRLRHATELCGEIMANLIDCHTGMQTSVAEVNALLWHIRWELLLAAEAPKFGPGDEAEGDEPAKVAS